MKSLCLAVLCLFLISVSLAQDSALITCGQKEITERLLNSNPAVKKIHEQAEQQLRSYNQAVKAGIISANRTQAVVTLPVVVHIVHNNGPENISDAQVMTAIQHLNEAFANTGYYDPSQGVNTQIQFCLAQRDPNGNATNGITRNVSTYTNMGGPSYYSDDEQVKNINRWNPLCYINIWVVADIPGSVAGYAYLPSAHGTQLDGIVLEAAWLGSSFSNDIVVIHEMGHYLGLYHTFEGGCTNNDCTTDGDRVCDTPPDQSTGYTSCSAPMNSCATDALSGFSTDENDLTQDYMDYGNFNCMKVFTQGQSDRMNWHIQNVRSSLLNCMSCLSPCPAPVTAGFSTSGTSVAAGTTVTFTNTSVNASGYSWYINNVLQATTTNFSYTFNTAGTYTIKLEAQTGNALCNADEHTEMLTVTCPVTASFTPPDTMIVAPVTLNFVNSSTGATSYTWLVNGVVQNTTAAFSYNFSTTGNYLVKLVATNGICSDSLTRSVLATSACTLHTFQQSYGGSGDDQAADVQNTVDGGFIIAGRTTSAGFGNYDGLLIKLDATGALQWSRIYGGPQADLFTRVIQAAHGGFLAVGQTKSFGYNSGAAWIVKFDASGDVQWSRQYAEDSDNGEVANAAISTSDGNYAIAGRHDNAPGDGNAMVLKLDAAGNLLWSKIFDDGDTDNGNMIAEDNGNLLVTGYIRTGASYHDGYMMKLNLATGDIVWSKSYEINGRNSFMGKHIVKHGNHYIINSPAINDFSNIHTGRHMLLNIDENGDITGIKEVVPANYSITGSGSFIVLNDGSIILQDNEDNSNSDLNLYKINTAGNVEWAKKFPLAGAQTNTMLITTPGGGLLSVGNTPVGGSNDIYIARMDIEGNAPGCNTTSVPVSITTPPYASSAFIWNTVRAGNFKPPQITNPQQAASPGLAINPMCSGTTPCVTPPANPCKNTSFQRSFGGAGNEIAEDIAAATGNEYIIAGATNSTTASSDDDALLVKLNPYGEPAWQKTFGGSLPDHFSKVIATADGNFIALGDSRSFHNTEGSMIVVKLNPAGNIIWSKEYNFTGQDYKSFTKVTGALELPSGNIAFCANSIGVNRNVGTPLDATFNIIGTLDNSGNLLWIKRIRPYYYESGGGIVGMAANNHALFLAVSGVPAAGIIKISQSNGDLIGMQRQYLNIGHFLSIAKDGDSLLVHTNHHRLIFDTALNLLKTTLLTMGSPSGDIVINGTSTADGAVIPVSSRQGSPVYQSGLVKFNNEGYPLWHYQYPAAQDWSVKGVRQTGDQGLVAFGMGNTGSGNNDIYILRSDSAGKIADCPRSQLAVDTIELQPAMGELVIRFYDITATVYSNIALPADVSLTSQALCNSQCNVLTISGQDTVCRPGDTLMLTAQRNPGCTAFTDWSVDTAYATVLMANDSTLTLLVKTAGSVTVYASLNSNCTPIQNSLLITILDPPDTIDLGPDMELCKLSTYTLHAGAGFSKYQWQDGSMDSTFTVYTPGIYYVTAKDHCGRQYTDTIVIAQAPDVPFDLGPDLEKCSNDTITITAPAGFTSYYWSPDFRAVSTSSPVLTIYTEQDTMYTVVAEKAPGCLVMDSIRVTVRPVTEVHLPNDTSICRNDTLLIDAGSGFSSYQWNTGALTQTISATAQGDYWVVVANNHQCKSRDTLTITRVYDLPPVQLGNDTIVCSNNQIIFDAGSGHISYTWQNGSGNQLFTATQPGQYWVQVTDINRCSNTDTVLITAIKDPPANFLPDTAHLCIDEQVVLKASQNFARYNWFNSFTTATASVTSPGDYWLEATDLFGCTGIDTIEAVGINCPKTIYFPNAFNPGSRSNNRFRPVVYGIPEKYTLIVFNRWGEKIFETNDPYRGWDGTYKGIRQDTNTYVWMCRYQFRGRNQTEKVEKGIVLLIR